MLDGFFGVVLMVGAVFVVMMAFVLPVQHDMRELFGLLKRRNLAGRGDGRPEDAQYGENDGKPTTHGRQFQGMTKESPRYRARGVHNPPDQISAWIAPPPSCCSPRTPCGRERHWTLPLRRLIWLLDVENRAAHGPEGAFDTSISHGTRALRLATRRDYEHALADDGTDEEGLACCP